MVEVWQEEECHWHHCTMDGTQHYSHRGAKQVLGCMIWKHPTPQKETHSAFSNNFSKLCAICNTQATQITQTPSLSVFNRSSSTLETIVSNHQRPSSHPLRGKTEQGRKRCTDLAIALPFFPGLKGIPNLTFWVKIWTTLNSYFAHVKRWFGLASSAVFSGGDSSPLLMDTA